MMPVKSHVDHEISVELMHFRANIKKYPGNSRHSASK